MNKLLYIFFDTDMRAQHDGLTERAKKEAKIKVQDLAPGSLLCFINRRRDRIKVLAGCAEQNSHGVLGYYKSPSGSIDIQSLQFIPEAFDGNRLTYDSMLRETLLERLEPKKRKKENGTADI